MAAEARSTHPQPKGAGGRRPGSTQTMDTILKAALASFAESGYDGTTIRGVARTADVDPALVMHFFGSKEGLFRAAVNSDNPHKQLVPLLDGPIENLGERLVRGYLDLWQTPATRSRMLAMLRAFTSCEAAASIMSAFISDELVPHVKAVVQADTNLRVSLAGAQLVGLSMARYVLKVEPLASMDDNAVVGWIAPSVQRYLTGDLGDAG